MRIGIVIFDGFDELDAIGPYEVLRNAAAGGADVEAELVTREPAATVTASHGLTLVPQGVIDGSHDLLIVAGGGYAERAEAGVFGEVERGDLTDALKGARDAGAAMASVCTGAMLLSAAGITAGRPATTHGRALDALAEQGALVEPRRVVDDGDLVTAGGVTAGIDLALWIVERHWGARLADGIAREMEHERGPRPQAADPPGSEPQRGG